MLNKKALAATAAKEPIYIEDTFSTYLYAGSSSTVTVTNNIDISGEGGLVWIKNRSASATSHMLVDTARGGQYTLNSDTTSDQGDQGIYGLTFSGTGFSVPNSFPELNTSGNNYASWTFRKAEKFFDVVTYTGNGSNRTIAHNLGSVPGCIIVKRTDTTGAWQVYHRSLANTEYLVLNTTAAKATGATRWNSTTPTSTEFSLGTDATVNANGGSYVAYLFAHDAGGFGDSGSDNVISCGSFTANASGFASINLGYEPQWLLVKCSSTTDDWLLVDNMRGFFAPSTAANVLRPNLSNAENTGYASWYANSTGFSDNNAGGFIANATYIYIAIRRGPMKTPEAGTEVFAVQSGRNSGEPSYTSGFPVDLTMVQSDLGGDWNQVTRLQGGQRYLYSNQTYAEANDSDVNQFAMDIMNGIGRNKTVYTPNDAWMFRRAPGFMDVVCYTGTGVNRTVTHNLGVAPEFIIIKGRSTAYDWIIYHSSIGNTKYLDFTTAAATTNIVAWNNTSPTSTVFTLGTAARSNENNATQVAYLFASVTGVSKVGSYTGNGSSQTINCGFTGGARFILIKRTDSTGDWVVFDSARGIVSGNDPYVRLNSSAAEVTDKDAVDPDSTGFIVNETTGPNINTNGGTYIYLAIA